MSIGVLLYENCAEFEIVQTSLILRNIPLMYVGLNSRQITSESRLKIAVDSLITELNPEELDGFIIPGGDPIKFIKDESLHAEINALNHILKTLNQKGKLLAAIGEGILFLANAEILDYRTCTGNYSPDQIRLFARSTCREDDLVVDDKIITAKGHAFSEFAVEIGKFLGIFPTEQAMDDTYRWLRNIKT